VFPKPYADIVARLRVPSGFLIVVVFAWGAQPTMESMLWGLPVSLLGLLLRGWAAGCLAKNQQLATGGPYAYTRNPLYVGTLLVAAGLSIASRSPGLAILFAAVFLLVYLPVIQNEEQHLRKLFPVYADYADRVPMLLGRRRRLVQPGALFRWQLYFKNQEYQAAIGYFAGLLFLFWKTGVA